VRADKLIQQAPVRGLIVGYPGAGKTGALAALANAGFKLRILDFDGNYQSLLAFVDPRALPNIDIVTLQDKLIGGSQPGLIAGKMAAAPNKHVLADGIPTAFNDALNLLIRWKYADTDGEVIDLGRPAEWGADPVLVIDSATSMAETSIRRAQKFANRTPSNMTSAVWGHAVSDFMNTISLARSLTNGYHFLMLAHIRPIGPADYLSQGDDDEVKAAKLDAISHDLIPTRLFPIGVTKPNSQIIHKDFTTMILAEEVTKPTGKKRVLKTSTSLPLDLKVPAKDLKSEYPIETGLADIFAKLGHTGPGLK
jgi:hypothetical protein